MSTETKQMVEQAREMITAARAMCDHANHYTCNDCGEFGYGNCPESWPCSSRRAA